MIPEIGARVEELRADPRVLKAEVVKFARSTEFWVTFREPIDVPRLAESARKLGYMLVGFGGFPSMLPRGISEIIWSGVTHIILKDYPLTDRLKAALGFEPPGIAKVALDLHEGTYQVYITSGYDGMAILYDYLGKALSKPPPQPPQPVKPAVPAAPARPMPPTRPPTPTPAAPRPPTAPAPPVTRPAPAPRPPTAPPTAVPRQPTAAAPQAPQPQPPRAQPAATGARRLTSMAMRPHPPPTPAPRKEAEAGAEETGEESKAESG